MKPTASLVMPAAFGLLVVVLGLSLLVIGARSPYTHANLAAAYNSDYSRTEQATVGTPAPFTPAGMADRATSTANMVTRGRELFVTKECAACHGLRGQGGAVAHSLAGFELDQLIKRVQEGPSGMPVYSSAQLTPKELDAIAAFLHSVGKPAQPGPGK